MIHKLLNLVLLLILLGTTGFAQFDISTLGTNNGRDQKVERPIYEQSADEKRHQAKQSELRNLKEDANRLLPPTEYATLYAPFLKDASVALARIYPDKNCSSEKTVSVAGAERCTNVLPIIGNGSFYSFRLKTNLNQKFSLASGGIVQAEWADIHLAGNKIEVGSNYVQGLITEISSLDFEAINKDASEVKRLKEYKPATELLALENQKDEISKGIQIGAYNYSKSASAKLGSAYLLRSVAYRYYLRDKGFKPKEHQLISRTFDFQDLRTDIIVAFKIIGEEKDGSLIILWKELSQKDAPILKGVIQY